MSTKLLHFCKPMVVSWNLHLGASGLRNRRCVPLERVGDAGRLLAFLCAATLLFFDCKPTLTQTIPFLPFSPGQPKSAVMPESFHYRNVYQSTVSSSPALGFDSIQRYPFQERFPVTIYRPSISHCRYDLKALYPLTA